LFIIKTLCPRRGILLEMLVVTFPIVTSKSIVLVQETQIRYKQCL
jgi:hypothetical protein